MPRLVSLDPPSRGSSRSQAQWRVAAPLPRVGCSTRLLWASLLEGLRAVVVTTGVAVALASSSSFLADWRTSREDAWRVMGTTLHFRSDGIAAMLVMCPQARCRLASTGASMPI